MPEWVIPEQWRRRVIPRRGGVSVPWPEPPAVAEDPAPGTDEGWVVNPGPRAEARAFMAAWADGPGELTPRGAAAAALLRDGDDATLAAESWVSRCGVVFAARAVAEMVPLTFHPFRRDEAVYSRALDTDGLQDWWGQSHTEQRRMHRDEEVLVTAAMTVRARLAVAADEEYAAAVEALGDHRSGPLPQRMITTFLAPARLDWVDADITAMGEWYQRFALDDRRLGLEGRLHMLLVLAASTVEQFWALDRAMDAAPLSAQNDWISHERMLGTLADVLGTDIMRVLRLDRYANLAGVHRSHTYGWTDQALTTLMLIPSDDAMRMIVERTLDTHLADFHQHGVLAREPARALRVLAESERSRSRGWLPSIYRDVIATVPGAVPDPADRALVDSVLGDGSGLGRGLAVRLDMGERHTTVFARAADRRQAITWLAAIRTDEALGLLAERADLRNVTPALLKLTKKEPVRALRVLAGWEAVDEHHRSVVADVLRHHVLAHPDVVRNVLHTLVGRAHDRVRDILDGAASAAPVAEAADVPAVLRSGARLKRLPGWLVVGALPGVPLHDGTVLPEPAVRELIDLIARSTFAAPQPGLAEVRAACDRSGLAAFAWALFGQWRAADHPSADRQAMLALGLLGDDTTVPAVSALFGEWAFGAAARVRTGIEVLGAIGSDVALTHLRRVSRKARQKGFRKLAEEKLDRIAETRGLTPAELADRIVPDLDLGADGRLLLDYGPRRFVVTFDSWLTPQIREEGGRALKRLPKPSASDDTDKATKAQAAYVTLKRELKDVAAERLRALEEAMLTERTWSVADFNTLIRDHPLVMHIARGLIWQVTGGPSFRIAEDRTPAGAGDTTLTLADDARIGLYHPAAGSPDLTREWLTILDDYEQSQPFPQLRREVHTLSPGRRAASRLDDFTGAKVAAGLLYATATRGWHFTDGHGALTRPWPSGHTVTIDFHPSYDPMAYDMDEPRELGAALITGPPGATFGDLAPIAASETLRVLHRLAAGD